jgi:class 3 adenylate cyclase/predicted ATPase
MTFEEILDQAIAMLRRRRRLTYPTLARQFQLDDSALKDLAEELIHGQRVANDEDGRVLVWAGEPAEAGASSGHAHQDALAFREPHAEGAERRQLTVLFCDLVDSTVLASRLDPEELREVVRAYQDACAKVIVRFDGHVAQYLGDGLLVYFGYPLAHEDDAQRAARAGLGMIDAVTQLNAARSRQGVTLAIRLGIHTGLVVVGEVGTGARQEQLALGETPNLAARLQAVAAPDTLVVSGATQRLLGGFFTCRSLGAHQLKGFVQPVEVYRVLYESTARSRLDVLDGPGLTELVGREEEIGLLRERWARVKEGRGQVVLLSGEAGIGKSRLVKQLKEHVAAEPRAWLTPCHCSPYHQHTALYPMIDVLERVALRFDREESAAQKLAKLEGLIVQYGLPPGETVPLFAALLSIPLTAEYSALNLTPRQQKQRTLQALAAILMRVAARQPLLFVMEDLHWVDPTTLELLSLLVEESVGSSVLMLLTFRPEFEPPWGDLPHLALVTLARLPREQAAEMTRRVAHGRALPADVVSQVVAKTDGVPLFVEELTKMVMESGLLREREGRYELTAPLPPLAIPTTLHDSLTARLDRLAAVKGMAQLGATLGRTFSYALLQAVSVWDDETLERGLAQLVEAEFLYQRGRPPEATFVFKHALIQEAAYQSLLRSVRQQHHHRIARVLEARFPELCETQPELLAHHYTEAGFNEQAIAYWQRAGRRAVERSAHADAVSHLAKCLELVSTLPDTPARMTLELSAQTALAPALIATKGYAAPEVKQAYTRARDLCERLGDTVQLFPVLMGLGGFHYAQGELQMARVLGEQCLALAQRAPDPIHLLEAHLTLGGTLFYLGALESARAHLTHASALYDPGQHRSLAFTYGHDPGVAVLSRSAVVLWLLGYPAQSLEKLGAALALASEIAHPFSLAFALYYSGWIHHFRGEQAVVLQEAERLVALCTEQGFAIFLPAGTIQRGWGLAALGQTDEGAAQIREGLVAWRATGAELVRPYWLALQAEAYARTARHGEALSLLEEALGVVRMNRECWWEPELHRLKGELALRAGVVPDADAASIEETHACFSQAIEIARQQGSRSLELRAAMSLARMWEGRGKRAEARRLLDPIYSTFTEGFDTADLRAAKDLLTRLS